MSSKILKIVSVALFMSIIITVSENIDVSKLVASQGLTLIFQISNFYVFKVTSLNAIDNSNVSIATPTPSLSFSDTFFQAVKNSSRLSQVMDVSILPYDASIYHYKSCLNALSKASVPNPDAVSKAVADAFYITTQFLTDEVMTYVIGNSMAVYLLTQYKIPSNKTTVYAIDFASSILQNYPKYDSVNDFKMIQSLHIGIIDFILESGNYPKGTIPSFYLSVAKQLFAMTVVREPTIELSVISDPGKIPTAYDRYGITPFVKTFINVVDSSVSLQSIFYSTDSASVTAQAWYDAAYSFCLHHNCTSPTFSANRLNISVTTTYNFMTKKTYMKSVIIGYALTIFGMGTLIAEKSEECAGKLAKYVEKLVNGFGMKSDLKTRLSAIFEALISIVSPDLPIRNQYSVFCYHVVNEFYAATNFKRPSLY